MYTASSSVITIDNNQNFIGPGNIKGTAYDSNGADISNATWNFINGSVFTDGRMVFHSDSSATVIFNDTSSNGLSYRGYGREIYYGNVIFNDSSHNSGIIYYPSSVIFNDSSYTDNSIINTTYGLNYVGVPVVFNDSSQNRSIITGNAIFNDSSTNISTVRGSVDVYYPVSRLLGGTVNGLVSYHGYPAYYFNDNPDFCDSYSVCGANDGDWGNAHNWWTDSTFSLHTGALPTYGDEVYIYSDLIGDSTHSASVDTATFENGAQNLINIVVSSGSTFNATSTNSGSIVGTTTFNGVGSTDNGVVDTQNPFRFIEVSGTSGHYWWSITSSADGSKLAAVDYYGSSSIWTANFTTPNNPNNDNTGPLIRQFTSSITPVLNFITDGGRNNWIITAYSATINLASSVYSIVTNIFKAFDNAIFVPGTSIENYSGNVVPQISIATSTSGTILKWRPSVNWDTGTSTCMYQFDGNNPANYLPLDCTKGGSDIPRPTGGVEHTLWVKGIDSLGNLSEKSSATFTYDNTSPVWTACGTDLLDENRTYYLANDVGTTQNPITCNITNSTGTTTLLGAKAGTTSSFKVNGNIAGNGHNLFLSNITITSTTTSFGANILIQNATTSDVVADGMGNGGNGGNISVATSTTGVITSNGASGSTHGGQGGTIKIWNSDAVLAGTEVKADGGDATVCGDGGDGGIIEIDNSDNYTATSNPGADQTLTGYGKCASPHTPGTHQIIKPVVTSRPTPPPTPTSTPTPKTTTSGSRSQTIDTSGLTPIFTVLPPVNKLSPIKLTPVPTFGDTTNKKSFSLGEGITSFLFAPLPENITNNLKTSTKLQTYLATQGFSKAQDLITLKNKPLPLKTASTSIPGLFTLKAAGLPVKLSDGNFSTNTSIDIPSYLTYNSNSSLSQLVKVSPKTQLTINILPTNKGSVTATFNGKEITFDKNSTTFKAPSTPGTYTLTTPSSPLTLIIEVVAPKSASVQQTTSTPISWFTKLLNLFHF